MTKSVKALTTVGVVLAVMVVGVALGLWLAAMPKRAVIGAQISYVEGTVEYSAGNNVWLEARKNLKLEQGYSVRTSEGMAIIDIGDGSQVRLNFDSQVKLEVLESKHIVVVNGTGDVYVRVTKSANRIFDVKVDEVTYRAQGTAFRTFCFDDKKGVEVYQSRVKILGVSLRGEILVEQGKRYFMVYKDDESKAMKVLEIDKNELKLDDFMVWNKEQDERISEFKEYLGILSDINSPTLVITSPEGDVDPKAGSVTISGFTERGAKVKINGKEITVDADGRFNYVLRLEGMTCIKVVATDELGNVAFRKIYVREKKETRLETMSSTVTATKTFPPKITPTRTAALTQVPKKLTTMPEPSAGIEITNVSIVAGPQSLVVPSYKYKKVTLGVSFKLVGGLTASAFKIVADSVPQPRYGSAPYAAYVPGGNTYGEIQVDAIGAKIFVAVCRYPEKDIYSTDASIIVPLATYTPTDTPTETFTFTLTPTP